MTPLEQRGVPVHPNDAIPVEELIIPDVSLTSPEIIITPPTLEQSLLEPDLVFSTLDRARDQLLSRLERLARPEIATQPAVRRLNFDAPIHIESVDGHTLTSSLRRILRLHLINARLRRQARDRRLALEMLQQMIALQRNETTLIEREARIRQEYLTRILMGDNPEHPGLTK